MADLLRMPRLSDTMEEGNIVAWSKKVGDTVKMGDVLAEVETDKATMELESFYEGVLLYIAIESGPAPVDGLIAIIGKKGEDFESLLKEEAAASQTKSDTQEPESKPATPAQVAQPVVSASAAVAPAPTVSIDEVSGRIKASPLAKTLAKQGGIPLSAVQGTGESGRIIKRDVEQFIASGGNVQIQQTPAMASVGLPDFQYGDVPVSQMRKTIARRLGESKFSAPHFYLTIDVNMDNAVAARKAINEKVETRISFNDFVVKACALALRKHPHINSSWFGDKMTYHKDINIGVAVAVEEGLLVPVVRNTDLKSMTEINLEVKELAGKAKNKKLTPQEMQGNTFTISNLGMFDIEEFTAIINPPDACILAVGSIVKKPVVKNDQIAVASMMKMTLSCDHRVVDGATGAKFLQTLKLYLENPVMMLV